MAEAIKNNPKAIIANIEKYSPTLYSLSSFELRLISITKVVESNLTASELAELKVAAEAVRAKQADVKDL